MLTLAHCKLRAVSHWQAVTQSFNALYLQAASTLMTVMVITAALTLPALFWIFSLNIHEATQGWQKNAHVSLYLEAGLSSEKQAQLLERVRHMDGVLNASLKTPEQAMAELQQQEGMADLMKYLSSNPLPAVIDAVPVLSMNTSVSMKPFLERLNGLPYVVEVQSDLAWVTQLQAVSKGIYRITQGFMLLLAAAVVLIIVNTLRLDMHRRQQEMRVLKLIGATDAYILRPFLYAGIWYGLIGGVGAVLCVSLFLIALDAILKPLAAMYQMHYSFTGLSVTQAYLLVMTAVSLGWVGAKTAVAKQLRYIEPYR